MSIGHPQFLNIKPEERKLVFSLVGILAMATLVLEFSDVIATGGFISKVGPNNVIWLWIVDMVISIVTAGLYAIVVDKMDRQRLVKGLTLGFALLFLALRFVFSIHAPAWISYPVLYILTDQFYAIFPLAFWAMVNDLFTSSESQRIYPIITMGVALGSILGNGLAAVSGWVLQRSGGEPAALLPINSLILLFGLAILQLAFSRRSIHARQAHDSFDFKQTINVGLDYIRNVPIFSYLAVCMLFSGLAFTVIEYHFLFSVDQSVSKDPLQFQTFYGTFKIVLIVSTLLIQGLVSSRFLGKLSLKNSFIFQPVSMAFGSVLALIVPGIMGAAGAQYLVRLVQQSWDEPARKSLENLVPDERRGRVAVMIDRYFYNVSTIVGSLVLGLLLFLGTTTFLNQAQGLVVYLGLSIAASMVAIWSALRLRKWYEKSMLDWRLARPRRKSALDGIEF
jgi:AAA family ATP:ADP antiporter